MRHNERSFNTLLAVPDIDGLRDQWHTVVLLDGDLLPGESRLLRQRCPGAELLALSPNPLLLQQLRDCAGLDRRAIGSLYTALRNRVPALPEALCRTTGLSLPAMLAAAHALSWSGLVRYEPQPMGIHQELSLQLLPPPPGKLEESRSPVNADLSVYLRKYYAKA